MKKILFLAFVAATSLTVLDCGDTKSNSVDSNGNCTDSLISDWNTMNSAHRAVNNSITVGEKVSNMRNYATQCDRFFANHPTNVTCKAQSVTTMQEVTADTATEKSKCDANKRQLADYDAAKAEEAREAAREAARRNNTPPTPPLSASAERATLVASVPQGSLIVTVHDRYDAMKLLREPTLVIQNGRLVTEANIELGVPYCVFQNSTVLQGSSTVYQDEKMTAALTNETVKNNGVDLLVAFSGKSVALVCHKWGTSLFTVGNLIDGVSPVFKVRVDYK